MSITPIPLSSLKRGQTKSQVNSFQYHLYECAHLLSVKNGRPDSIKHLPAGIDVLKSSFYEGSGRSLIALVCSNGHLLFYLREGQATKPIVKQLNWFQNPGKQITSLCIDPIRGSWIVCACADSSVYLVPALTQMKDSIKDISLSLPASTTDISRVQYAKPLKGKGKPTCVIWWHTIDDQNVGIVGTKAGELVFLDLSQRIELCRTVLKEKIVDLELLQDIHERTTHLFVRTDKNWTLQLLLEQPSQTTNFSSSLTQGYDMGYDMLTECSMESILTTERKDSKDDHIPIQNRVEVLPQDFQYSAQPVKDNIWITKLDSKFSAVEIFSDIKRVPEFVYHVPSSTKEIVLCTNLMFAVFEKEEKLTMSLLSRQLSSTSFGRQGLKKPDPSMRADLQTFQLGENQTLINCFKSKFASSASWENLFPHNVGYDDVSELNSFFVVTNNGIFECRPRISPEHYFCELAIKNEIDVAERLGITLDLNVPLLCEYIGDKVIQGKDIPAAMKFYHLSKCSVIKRATNIVEFGSVTDALIYIKQVLKKQQTSLASKEKKSLADMAIACYVEQVLECQQGGSFSKNLAESFRSFLCDNFDYDEKKAMQLLVEYGMINNLFEVGKARGKIEEALALMASRGFFQLSTSIQNKLLDCGYAEKVCKACNGLFVKFMAPEDAVKFLLAQPDVSKPFIKKLKALLPKLNETSLLLVARVFDPSRQFIKPYLEKSDAFKRQRTGSRSSLVSMQSSSVQTEEDPYTATASDIIAMFLTTMIYLNSRRTWKKFPDMRVISKSLSGQFSWTGSFGRRSESLGSNEIVFSEIAQKKIDCGRYHSAFVTAEKELYTWGHASFGRLGHGDLMDENATSQPMRVESLHMHGIQVMSVSCGAMHTVALCQEGVFAWGHNRYGQLGVGDKRKRSRPVLLSDISSKYINSVVCGHYHTLAITIDHKLYAWGWGIHGQLGLTSNENQVNPQLVSFFKDERIVQAAAGYAHSAVLTSRGMVYTFGAGLYGQLGIGTNKKETLPQLVDTLLDDSIYLIACGCFETLAVSEEQTIFCWGRNYHQYHICGKASNARYGRQMASNTTDISHRYYPEDLPFKLQQPITQLICGNWHYMALTSNGLVYTWGCNDCGQLGHYNKIDQPAPRLVKALSRRCVSHIAAGSEFSLVIDADEQVLAWGCADGGLIGIENEGTASSNPVARRSAYSVLAPTLVPGLPMHFDQVSIGSGHSMSREYVFDQHYDLPDLSAIGQDQPPYSVEAVLLSLYKLSGLYSRDEITQYALQLKHWFVLSFCYELNEQWDLAFTYRMRSVKEYLETKDTELNTFRLSEKCLVVVANLFKKFEDFLTETFQENTSLVHMIKCMVEIFNFWTDNNFLVGKLEDLMRKHMESLCSLFVLSIFGFLGDIKSCNSNILRFALYHASIEHPINKQFTKDFYHDLLHNVTTQIDTGSNWYDFLSFGTVTLDKNVENENFETLRPLGGSNLSKDDMIKEIIEHKRKTTNIKPCITLSNAIATTLADASTAQKVNIYNPTEMKETSSQTGPDSVVFSCNHNLPRYYMLETVVPEFLSRMGELPQPLSRTGEVLSKYYEQTDIKIPMACPYCVYNNLRMEQLQIIRESGLEMTNLKSSVWEI